MKINRSLMKATLCVLFLFISTFLQAQEDEYWTLKPGFVGRYLVQIDSTKLALIANDTAYVPHENLIRLNTLRVHYFDNYGQHINSTSINFSDHKGIIRAEPLRTIFFEFNIGSLHSIFRLEDGRFLVGGHGVHENNALANSFNEIQYDMTEQNKAGDYSTEYLKTEGLKDTVFINPMIFTVSPDFDELLKVDTLHAVPSFGSVTLIHKIAPDTIIIGYHKTNESRHELLETDSLYNVRWKTEFGQINSSAADIYDFTIASDGSYLISLQYINHWVPHFLGYRYNILYKFSKTGELLWQKNIRKNNNTISFMNNIIPLDDDEYLLVYDNCCIKPPNFYDLREIILHEETGIYLRVINSDGVTLSEKSLVDFLSAYVSTYTGYQPYGTTIENPDEAYPWFYPLQTIKNPDNSFLIAGTHYPTGHQLSWARGFLLKIDEDFNPLWLRIYDIDNKNYRYGANRVSLNSILVNNNPNNSLIAENANRKIFLGGTFLAIDFYGQYSPYYNPPNYYPYFKMGLIMPLDQYGCYKPGCHITFEEDDDNSISVLDISTNIDIYPNPAKDYLHVKINVSQIENKTKLLFIHDINGKGMLTENFTGNEYSASLMNYPPGIYTAFIMCEGNILKTEKIVIRR